MEDMDLYERTIKTIMASGKIGHMTNSQKLSLQSACEDIETLVEDDDGEFGEITFVQPGDTLSVSIILDDFILDSIIDNPFMSAISYFDSLQFHNVDDSLRITFSKQGICTPKK